MDAAPVTREAKTRGTTIILMSRMKMSPKGLTHEESQLTNWRKSPSRIPNPKPIPILAGRLIFFVVVVIEIPSPFSFGVDAMLPDPAGNHNVLVSGRYAAFFF
jgi:hypothetical protein